ncbi:MAG: zinc dependent phospholipase C family protein [Alphaproteobacteria bacterium]|nr:zinc dependent phospholipase C family protein [Alphaproteobacteria bacterium]
MLAALVTAAALACGQTTHVTIALWALDRVEDPELAALVRDPEVRAALISGAMFPDGGYSPLVNHPYGEIAHWEPFQLALLDTLVDRGPTFEGDDRKRVAFLLGLAAHGIADQGFDAAYLTRADTEDAGAPRAESADTETDVAFAGEVGGLLVEERWVPYDELIPVFASQGIDVDQDTMELGMASLDLAILYVANAGELPDRVAQAHQNWPWATSHLTDPSVPGSPALLQDVVARYWEVLWRRLRQLPVDDRFVLAVWPGPYDVPQDALVSVVFGRALDEATIEAPGVVSVSADGTPLGVEPWMYYGQASNVLNVRPTDPWVADSAHDLTVAAGVTTFDGWTLPADLVLTFSTGAAPADPSVTGDPSGCGCATGGAPGWAGLLAAWAWLRPRRRSRS